MKFRPMKFGMRIAMTVVVCALGLLGWLNMPRKPWPMPAPHSIERGLASPRYLSGFIFDERAGQSCHVASVVGLDDGSLLAAWYAGSREGARDVAIYTSRMDAATGLWSAPRAVMDRERASRELGLYIKKVGNALLARDTKNRLWLFYVTISAGGWSGSTLNAMHSADGGTSWSTSRRLHLSPFFNLTNNIKNKPVLMADGSLLIPAYHEFARKFSEALLFDPSSGSTRKARMTSGGRLIQPGLAVDSRGRIVALLRNMREGFAMRIESADGGGTWSKPQPTDLPNPNSGLDIISLSDGRLLAAANDLSKGRHRLSLLVSSDRGMRWQRAAIVEEGPEGAEYSYPFLARGADGTLHLLYTCERKRIKHVAFNEAWLAKQEGLR